jgi:hypothetical protein
MPRAVSLAPQELSALALPFFPRQRFAARRGFLTGAHGRPVPVLGFLAVIPDYSNQELMSCLELIPARMVERV